MRPLAVYTPQTVVQVSETTKALVTLSCTLSLFLVWGERGQTLQEKSPQHEHLDK